MWRNQKFCQIWRNFKILHMTDVKKSEIYPVFGCEICFVAIYAIFCLNCFVVIYALLCGKKLSRKLYRWRKNDKYEVCSFYHMPNPSNSDKVLRQNSENHLFIPCLHKSWVEFLSRGVTTDPTHIINQPSIPNNQRALQSANFVFLDK